jgi:hypothetical protein
MKSIYKKLIFSILAIGLTTVIACKKNGGGNSLSVNPDSFVFQATGGTNSMDIKADAAKWDLSSNVSWIQLSQVTGNKGTATVIITALSNPDTNSRTATITLSAENAPTVQISVSQIGSLYPSYNTSPIAPDATGMSSTVTQLAAKIKLGFQHWQYTGSYRRRNSLGQSAYNKSLGGFCQTKWV